MRPKRRTISFPDGFKLTFSELAGIHPSNQNVADAMRQYMTGRNKHDIRECERIVMNQYEEEKTMAKMDCVSIKFRWRVIAKQHNPPFHEKYVFAVYSGKSLLSAVFEDTTIMGFAADKEDLDE